MPLAITISIEDNTEPMWGVKYARQEANRNAEQRHANVVSQNAQITAQNEKLLPEFHQPLIELPVVHTDASYLQSKLDSCVSEMTQNMLRAAEQNLITFAKSLPKADLANIIAAAGAPPLINS